ncbi:MAG: hypothetical protein JWO60_1687 [Frankiales bacterium]|nr:hypothetical protein [Frankiales bacterium]
MTRRRLLARTALTGVLAGLVLSGLPAQAESVPTVTVGSESRPGTADGFRLLGSTDLGGRGLNSPLAVAGDCAYVGDRDFTGTPRKNAGVAIVDISKDDKPTQVGAIPAVAGVTQRELRADRDLGLLLVMTYGTTGATSGNALEVYDIKGDCTKPRKLSTYDFGVRPPHEFFWWKDPKNPGRSLAYVTTTLFAPDLTVLDLTDPTAPSLRTTYDLVVDQLDQTADAALTSGSGYLHSLSVSDDGTRAYMGTWDFGTYVADTSLVADPSVPVPVIVPIGAAGRLDYGGNVHGTVPLPGRPYGVMVEEAYANAGKGCPFGWLRMVDLRDEGAPKVAGEFKVPENDCEKSQKANGTFTAHNQTTFPNVALLTWYAGGLRAVDVSDPNVPTEGGVFVPKGTVKPGVERDERLFFAGSKVAKRSGAMWSYPVVQDGKVYAVDIDLGLYVLEYTGPHSDEVDNAAFVEGNSSPSRYSDDAPRLRRPALVQAKIDALRGARTVKDLTPVPPGTQPRTWDWTC